MDVPKELDESARVDGCSEWRVMTKVILPMAKPGIAATAIRPSNPPCNTPTT